MRFRDRFLLAALTGAAVLLGGCHMVVPGRTAGETWGGAWSAQFAPKPAEKKDEKQEAPKEAKPVAGAPAVEPGLYDRPGFVTRQAGERLWAFRSGSKELAEFLKGGEPGKSATLVGAGPGGMTVRGPDLETVQAYVAARPGFEVWVKDGRVWAFKAGSKDAQDFAKGGEPGKSATLVGAGPMEMSVRSSDLETAQAYVAALNR